MVAVRALILEPTAPGWAQRMVLALKGYFLPLVPSSPVMLASFPSTSLPDPAAYAGCLIYVPDKAKVGLSNGAAWTNAIGGAL
jgi:hypothetical protein